MNVFEFGSDKNKRGTDSKKQQKNSKKNKTKMSTSKESKRIYTVYKLVQHVCSSKQINNQT